MPMRFRRSVGLGKGMRLNVNKSSVGMSFGVRGARYSVNASGRRTTSVVTLLDNHSVLYEIDLEVRARFV